MRHIKVLGHDFYFQSPVRFNRRQPAHWKCVKCLRYWRFDQTDDYGKCKCGGSVRRQKAA